MTAVAGYQNVLRSRATRKISMRSSGSSRGFFLAMLPIFDRPIIMNVESDLERKTGLVVLSRPDLVDLQEQAFQIQFTDVNGRKRDHTIDFLTTFADGSKVAIVVKNKRTASEQKFLDEFECIRAAMPRHLADETVLVTNKSFTTAQVSNAAKLNHFRMFPDPEADEVLAEALKKLEIPTSIFDLGLMTGLAGRAYRAAFRLIFAGIAQTLETGVIRTETLLFQAGAT